jgi:hypothetical protein
MANIGLYPPSHVSLILLSLPCCFAVVSLLNICHKNDSEIEEQIYVHSALFVLSACVEVLFSKR